MEDWIRELPGNQSGDILPFRGAYDVDWTAKLKEEGGWLVVSADNGKARGEVAKTKGSPLHLILPAREITGFFLGGAMSSRPGFEKIRAIYYVFPEMIELYQTSPPGTRHKIIPSGTGYRMMPWPLKSNERLPDLGSI